jgi:hypothetical protein
VKTTTAVHKANEMNSWWEYVCLSACFVFLNDSTNVCETWRWCLHCDCQTELIVFLTGPVQSSALHETEIELRNFPKK